MEINHTWEELSIDVSNLTSRIHNDKFKPQFIIGITRGGLIPATMLSHRLDCPLLTYDPLYDDISKLRCSFERNSILIVDEINDSGTTINSIRKSIIKTLKGEYREGWEDVFELNNIKFLTLYNNLNSMAKVDYFSNFIDKGGIHKDLWINFAWE